MNIEVIPGCNMVLGAPKGWDAAKQGTEVLGLPVIKGEKGYVSQWRPSEAELADMNRGAPVRLYVLGQGHPPVAVEVGPLPQPSI